MIDYNELKLLFNYLENNQKYLSPLQNDFVSTLKRVYKWTGVLTNKQVECLYDIREYIPVEITVK